MWSEVPWGRSAIPGHSGSGPSAQGTTSSPGRPGPVFHGLQDRPSSRATGALVRGHAESSSCPGRLRSLSLSPQHHQLPWATWARVRVLAGSPSTQEHLAVRAEGPPGQPAVPEDSRMATIAGGVDKLFRVTQARVRGPARSTTCPGRLGPGSEDPQSRPAPRVTQAWLREPFGIDQLSRATQAIVRGPPLSTRCLGRLALGSAGPWC